MTRIISIILALIFISCNNPNNSNGMEGITKPVENIDATKDQRERRLKSEAYCKLHNIPIYTNPTALFVDPEDQVSIRNQNEVIDRTLALYYIGLKSEDIKQSELDKVYIDFSISSKLSDTERSYVTTNQPTSQQKIDANWRYESLHVMLWSLGFIDSLSYPDTLCNVANDTKIIYNLTENQFRGKAKLRTKKEILDAADLILRLDWACNNARIINQTAPGHLDKGVVYERHYSLNWLINYMQQNWDDIKTDT